MSQLSSVVLPIELWTYHILTYCDVFQLFKLSLINKEFNYNITNSSLINNPSSKRFKILKKLQQVLQAQKIEKFFILRERVKNLDSLSPYDIVCFLILNDSFDLLYQFGLSRDYFYSSYLDATYIKIIIDYGYTQVWDNFILTKHLIKYNNCYLKDIKKEWLNKSEIIEAAIEGNRDISKLYYSFNNNDNNEGNIFPIIYNPELVFIKNNFTNKNLLKIAVGNGDYKFLTIPIVKQLIDELIFKELDFDLMSQVINIAMFSPTNDNYTIPNCAKKLEEIYGTDFVNLNIPIILLSNILNQYNGTLIKYIKDENIKNEVYLVKCAIWNSFESYIYLNKEMKENVEIVNEIIPKKYTVDCPLREKCLNFLQNFGNDCPYLLITFFNKFTNLRYYCKEIKNAFENLRDDIFLEIVLPKLNLFGIRSGNGFVWKLLPKRFLQNDNYIQKIIDSQPQLKKSLQRYKMI